jgi:TonB family protein
MKHLCLLLCCIFALSLQAKSQNTTGVLNIAEVMPKYPTGDTGLYKFIRQNIHYPQACIDSGIQGKVYVRFVVTANGSIKNAEIIKGVHPLLNAEALSVVSQLPAFIPGKNKGKNVDVYFAVPISFELLGLMPRKSTVFQVLSSCDIEPQYPGGDEVVEKLFAAVRLPKDSAGKLLEGQCTVGFIVDTNGNARNIQIVLSANNAIDNTVISLIKSLQTFTPARLAGKKVSAYLLAKFNYVNTPPLVAAAHNLQNPPTIPGGDDYIFDRLEKEIRIPQTGSEPESGSFSVNFAISDKGVFAFSECSEVSREKEPWVEKQTRMLLPEILTGLTPAHKNDSAIAAFYNISIHYRNHDGNVIFERTNGLLKQAKDAPVFLFAGKMPEFKGGDRELLTFLNKNLQYPRYELNKGIQGRVLLKFIIDEQGDVSDIQIIKGVSTGIDKEALRVTSMLKFSPAECSGEKVKIYYNLPVSFKLN